MKHQRIKIFLVVTLIMSLLFGCQTSKETSSEQPYIKYNETTELWEITERAFKDSESLNKAKLDPNVAGEVYIAMFGVKEFKLMSRSFRENNAWKAVFFLDKDNKAFMISDDSGEITKKEVPRLVIDDIYYLEEINQISEENYYMWEDLIKHHMEFYEEDENRNYRISEYEFSEDELGEKYLYILLEEGDIVRLSLDFPEVHPIYEYSRLNIFNSDDPKSNSNLNLVDTSHGKNYTKADLNKLPIYPQVLNDESNSIDFYYPELDKKYVILLSQETTKDFKYYLDNFGLEQSYDLQVYDIVESDNGVKVTFFLEFYPVGNWEVGGFTHEYQWRNGQWVLVNEEFEIYDVAENLRLEVGDKTQTKMDMLSVLENKVWVCPDDIYQGATIEFKGNQIYIGFYMSESENSGRYKVEQIKDNILDLLVDEKDKMKIEVVNNGYKIKLTFKNDTTEYITENEWERIRKY